MTNANNPQTPGVYTVEKNAFPPSVAQVPTAIPAFIGYTEIAENQGKSLINKPTFVTSLHEYNNYFGGAPEYKFLQRQTHMTSLFLPITTKSVLPSRTPFSTCTTVCDCSI